MRLIPKSLKWRAVICGLVAGVFVAYVGFGTSTGRHVLYRLVWGEDALAIRYLRDAEYPLVRDLARGEIRTGDSFDELVTKYRLDDVTAHGEYHTAGFSGSCLCGGNGRVMAKNGRLVFACQDIGPHYYTFFDTHTPEEHATAEASLMTAEVTKRRQWVVSSAAVLGVAAIARRAQASEFPPVSDHP